MSKQFLTVLLSYDSDSIQTAKEITEALHEQKPYGDANVVAVSFENEFDRLEEMENEIVNIELMGLK